MTGSVDLGKLFLHDSETKDRFITSCPTQDQLDEFVRSGQSLQCRPEELAVLELLQAETMFWVQGVQALANHVWQSLEASDPLPFKPEYLLGLCKVRSDS